jgi:hypothetical protein
MLWFYESFFPVLWIGFLIYWQIKAVDTKTNQRLEPVASRILRALTLLIAIVLLSTTRIPLGWLYLQPWPTGFWPFWLGATVMVAGLLFAVWAREHLGRNWSRSVTIKQGHELITTGPRLASFGERRTAKFAFILTKPWSVPFAPSSLNSQSWDRPARFGFGFAPKGFPSRREPP